MSDNLEKKSLLEAVREEEEEEEERNFSYGRGSIQINEKPKINELKSSVEDMDSRNQIKHISENKKFNLEEEESLLGTPESIEYMNTGLTFTTIKKGEGIGSSIFNLTNGAIGAGVLSFPYAFYESGILAGLFLSVCLALLSYISMMILVRACPNDRSVRSYQELVSLYLSPQMAKFSSVCVMGFVEGACIVYMTVIGDTVHPVLDEYMSLQYLTKRKIVITLFSICFIFPMCLFRDIGKLSITSGLAVLGACTMMGFVVESGIEELSENGSGTDERGVEYYVNLDPNFFFALPIICFAFQVHIICVPVYHELSNPTPKRMSWVIIATMGICFAVYCCVGMFGHIKFGEDTESDIIEGYSNSDIGANFARFAIGTTATFSYPVMFFTIRLSIIDLWFHDRSDDPKVFYGITIGNFFLTLIIALFVPDISDVFGLIGSTAAVFLMFIFPGLIGLKKEETKSDHMISMLVLIGGTFLGIAGTAATIYQMF